jgi:hypothetical protein
MISPGMNPRTGTMLDAGDVLLAGQNGSGGDAIIAVNAATGAPDSSFGTGGSAPIPSALPAGANAVGAAIGSDGNVYVVWDKSFGVYMTGYTANGLPLTANGFSSGLKSAPFTGSVVGLQDGPAGSLEFAGLQGTATPIVGSFDLATGTFIINPVIPPTNNSWSPTAFGFDTSTARFDLTGQATNTSTPTARQGSFIAVVGAGGGSPASTIFFQFDSDGAPSGIDGFGGQLFVTDNNPTVGLSSVAGWTPGATNVTGPYGDPMPPAGYAQSSPGMAPIQTSTGPQNVVAFNNRQGSNVAVPYVALFNSTSFPNSPLQLGSNSATAINLVLANPFAPQTDVVVTTDNSSATPINYLITLGATR